MSRLVFDMDDVDYLHRISDDMAINSDGDMMMRLSEHMAMDMDSGDIHFVSAWGDEDD